MTSPSFDGRVAIVAGATGALGRIVAREFVAGGASVGLLGSRLEGLTALAAELDLPGDRWHAEEADLTDAAVARAAVDAIAARFGALHVVVNAIGGYAGGTPVSEVDPAEITGMLDQHLWTTFHLARASAPHLIHAGWGRIIGVSTPIASTPAAKMAPYAVGKAAQEALLMTLAKELAGTGVTVNVVQVRKIDKDHEREHTQPPKPAAGTTPEEIAAAILYLCSDEAGIVSGVRVPVFGGA